jgi:MFS family permease
MSSNLEALQRRTVSVLMVSQALGGVGVSSGVAVAALLAERILGSASLAGLAQTSQVFGAALAAYLLARVMATRGRRAGLALGYGAGALGAALCIVAGLASSFGLLLAGTLAIGAATAANNQARYAATDLAEPDHRARALSLVVWATTLGSVLGPNLAGPGAALARSLRMPELTGVFFFAAAAVGLATVWITLRLVPDPLLVARQMATARGESGHAAVSLRRVLGVVRGSPRAAAATVAIAAAHTVMVSVMVMTPLHMHHGGSGLEIIGFVISMHVLGMFALAPLVGWLVDRMGRAAVLALGSAVLLAAVALAGRAPPGDSAGLTTGLFLLGAGWSCCLVASSALLVDAVPVVERPGVQGASDLLTGLAAAGGGALAGVVVARWGYAVLNAGAGVLALVVLGAAVVARERLPLREG